MKNIPNPTIDRKWQRQNRINRFVLTICFYLLVLAMPTTFAQTLLPVPNLPLVKQENGQVTRISLAADGSVLVIGSFFAINRLARSGIARFDAAGNLDPTFAPDVIGVTDAIAAPDGKIYISGTSMQINGQIARSPSRLNSDGTLDTNFIASMESNGPIAIDSAARVYVGTRRYSTNGAVDSSWSLQLGGSQASLSKISISANQVYVVGVFTSINGIARTSVARLSMDGVVDSGFNIALGGSNPLVLDIEIADSDVFLAGTFTSIGGFPNQFVAKLSTAGVVDGSWNVGVDSTVTDIEVDGATVFIGGLFRATGGAFGPQRDRLAQVSRTSATVSSFNPSIDSAVLALKATPSRLWVGGSFDRVRSLFPESTERFALAQIDKMTGLPLEQVTHAQGPGEVHRILPLNDGGFLIAGSFILANPERTNLLKLRSDFSLDLSFSASTNNTVFDASQDANGNIFIGGNFTAVNGQQRRRLAELNPQDGSLTGWCAGADLGANNTVNRVGANPVGTFVGGFFSNISGFQNSTNSARISFNCTPAQPPGFIASAARMAGMASDGFFTYQGSQSIIGKRSLQTGLNIWTQSMSASGGTPRINRIIIESNRHAYLVGQFSHINSQTRVGIARIDHINGTLEDFAPITSAPVNFELFDIASDNRYVYFFATLPITIGSTQRTGFMRVERDSGQVEPNFSISANNSIWTSAISNQRLLAGGNFSHLGGNRRLGLGAFTVPGPPVDSLFRSGFELTSP